MIETWYARVREGKPFLRWAGGKQYFLFQFASRIPSFSGTYIEPFLGSGAVFFKVMGNQTRPGAARLGDVNKQLIQCFLAVRDDPEKVYRKLESLQQGYLDAPEHAEFFYEQRDIYNATLPKPDPALFIFLNRTCWNGLYRVNLAGRFNVPYGAPKSDTVIPSLDELLNASACLAQASLRVTSWQHTLAFAQPGDFVFLDPPYYSEIVAGEREKRRMGKYNKRGFGLREHTEVAQALAQLASRGIDFMLTNSAEPEMVERYESRGLQVSVIKAPRLLNSKAERRSTYVDELLVTPPGAPYGIQEQLALEGMGDE
jgi:DNA adenine methylase